MEKQKQQYFTAGQIAKMCGLTKVTILKHRRKGLLPQIKKDTATGAFRFPRNAVENYLDTQHCIRLENVEGENDE